MAKIFTAFSRVSFTTKASTEAVYVFVGFYRKFEIVVKHVGGHLIVSVAKFYDSFQGYTRLLDPLDNFS